MTDIESLVALGEGITPGPWDSTAMVSFHDRPDLPCVVDEYRLVVAQCWDDGHSEDECEANARAIAAVPDLIAAIRTLQTEKVELLAIVDDELSRKPPAHDLTEFGEGGVAALLAVKRRFRALSNTGEME